MEIEEHLAFQSWPTWMCTLNTDKLDLVPLLKEDSSATKRISLSCSGRRQCTLVLYVSDATKDSILTWVPQWAAVSGMLPLMTHIFCLDVIVCPATKPWRQSCTYCIHKSSKQNRSEESPKIYPNLRQIFWHSLGRLVWRRLWMPQTCLGSVQRLFSTVPQIQCKGTRALAVSRTCADLIFVNYTDAAFYVLCFVLYGRGDVYLQDCWLVVFFAVVVTVLVSLAYIFVLGSLKAEGIQLIHWNASANMCHPQLQRAWHALSPCSTCGAKVSSLSWLAFCWREACHRRMPPTSLFVASWLPCQSSCSWSAFFSSWRSASERH